MKVPLRRTWGPGNGATRRIGQNRSSDIFVTRVTPTLGEVEGRINMSQWTSETMSGRMETVPTTVNWAQITETAGKVASEIQEISNKIIQPLDIFDGNWTLNFILLFTFTILLYSLLVLVPRQ